MSAHTKLAAMLRTNFPHSKDCIEAYQPRGRMDPDCLACEIDILAGEVESGQYNDALGASDPSVEDLKKEAVRAYGPYAVVSTSQLDARVSTPHFEKGKMCGTVLREMNTSVEALYAALLTLPDCKEPEE